MDGRAAGAVPPPRLGLPPYHQPPAGSCPNPSLTLKTQCSYGDYPDLASGGLRMLHDAYARGGRTLVREAQASG